LDVSITFPLGLGGVYVETRSLGSGVGRSVFAWLDAIGTPLGGLCESSLNPGGRGGVADVSSSSVNPFGKGGGADVGWSSLKPGGRSGRLSIHRNPLTVL
jgi:hypothetical protein